MLFVLLWNLDLSVIHDLSVLQECPKNPKNALREPQGLIGQNVLLAPNVILECWKSVYAQIEHQELSVTHTLSYALSALLAPL